MHDSAIGGQLRLIVQQVVEFSLRIRVKLRSSPRPLLRPNSCASAAYLSQTKEVSQLELAMARATIVG